MVLCTYSTKIIVTSISAYPFFSFFPFIHRPEPSTKDPAITAPNATPYFHDNGLATTPALAPFLSFEPSLTVGVADDEDELDDDESPGAVTEDGATTFE